MVCSGDFGSVRGETIALGWAIPVKKTLNLTEEMLDKLHHKYCTELTNLSDEYKTKFGISEKISLNLIDFQ
ncbi:unnamed protein product [Anisakis simplex]|uniref:FAD_binding_3 domain-containing protein n=1 Tax=Anisakis simplex TaxID=6269 RepID=A0A0M3K340_ANISI|nr:unnamed protein product [Anisakis simplex]